MDDQTWLADRFESNRSRLSAIAYRMLGSASEADDAVQEAWIRLSRWQAEEIGNLSAWLTTVVSRVCLDMLRSRTTRREFVDIAELSERPAEREDPQAPEEQAIIAESLGFALIVVLETLTPAERIAYVLHDLFTMPFDEIAPIVDRSTEATRQLASRARRRIQGGTVEPRHASEKHREVVRAFLEASREGDFEALLSLLDPDVLLRADEATIRMGGDELVSGARHVAQVFSGRAQAARLAEIDGEPGALWAPNGKPRVAFRFRFVGDAITTIELISDRTAIREMRFVTIDDE